MQRLLDVLALACCDWLPRDEKVDPGAVEKGKLADLVLLDADPLEDIANTQRLRGVVLAGRYCDRAALDRLLRGVEKAAADEPAPAKPGGTP